MKLCYSGASELVLLVLVLLKVGLVSGAADKNEIRNYLTKIIDDEESWTHKTLDRDEILSRYMENTERVQTLRHKVTYTEVIQLHISVAQNSAVLNMNAPCSIKTQQDFNGIKGHNLAIHRHFQSLAQDGRKYCNFFKYLVCRDIPDPKSATGWAHKCVCPVTMVWQTDRCVFELGKKCMDGNGKYSFYILHRFRFYLWNFNRNEYDLDMPSRCEASSLCQPDTNTCETKSSFTLFATSKQLAEFLKKRFEADNPGHSSGSELTEAIRETLLDIEKPYRLSDYYFLSLEYEMEQRLLERVGTMTATKP